MPNPVLSLIPPELSAAITAARVIAGVAKEAGKFELQTQVIELHTALMELQQTMLGKVSEQASLIEENASLRRDLVALRARYDALEAEVNRRHTTTFENATYWRREGKKKDGPFCARCHDAEQKFVRMTPRRNGVTHCVSCKYSVPTPGHVAQPRAVPARRVISRAGWISGR